MTPGRRQYVVLKTDNIVKYNGWFNPYISLIYKNAKWAVWRRNPSEAVAFPFTIAHHGMNDGVPDTGGK